MDLKEMNELPNWLQKLWEINPSLAREAEKDYLSLKSENNNGSK